MSLNLEQGEGKTLISHKDKAEALRYHIRRGFSSRCLDSEECECCCALTTTSGLCSTMVICLQQVNPSQHFPNDRLSIENTSIPCTRHSIANLWYGTLVYHCYSPSSQVSSFGHLRSESTHFRVRTRDPHRFTAQLCPPTSLGSGRLFRQRFPRAPANVCLCIICSNAVDVDTSLPTIFLWNTFVRV